MSKMHIRKGDTVKVISGKEGPSSGKAKVGKVLQVFPKSGKVIVEGVNLMIKHVKPRRAGETGGRIKKEVPIYACKVMHVCNRCNQVTRIGRRVLGDGTHVRYCKKCQEDFSN